MTMIVVGTDTSSAADPAAYLAGMASRFPAVTLRTRVVDGDPAERICEIAAEVVRTRS